MTPEEIIAKCVGDEVIHPDLIAACLLEDFRRAGYTITYTGGSNTHWDGCWEYHHACAVALIKATH